jgi:hypothetical protein
MCMSNSMQSQFQRFSGSGFDHEPAAQARAESQYNYARDGCLSLGLLAVQHTSGRQMPVSAFQQFAQAATPSEPYFQPSTTSAAIGAQATTAFQTEDPGRHQPQQGFHFRALDPVLTSLPDMCSGLDVPSLEDLASDFTATTEDAKTAFLIAQKSRLQRARSNITSVPDATALVAQLSLPSAVPPIVATTGMPTNTATVPKEAIRTCKRSRSVDTHWSPAFGVGHVVDHPMSRLPSGTIPTPRCREDLRATRNHTRDEPSLSASSSTTTSPCASAQCSQCLLRYSVPPSAYLEVDSTTCRAYGGRKRGRDRDSYGQFNSYATCE